MLGKKQVQEESKNKNPDAIGALWVRPRDGKPDLITGKVGDQDIVVFENGFKEEGDNKPNFIIYKSKPRPTK